MVTQQVNGRNGFETQAAENTPAAFTLYAALIRLATQ
jgi:hypothetical protein